MTDQSPPDPDIASGVPDTGDDYTVLARKYRPADFQGLIGQQAMVRTLTNAIGSGRLAHAFILTGVRGVGKTTTARIIARVLNCIGADGTGGPTASPCGICEHCLAIAQDRHVDVLEMDAASRTGVGDIRELIESVRYRPTSARYKIYIIDEVHMLSNSAFNALLKTLEEPPEHVKFIFATTEIRKIPVTVLSRCQRFDLRRVEMQTLSDHFAGIAEQEGAKISDGALAMIARAADGSVRDGLSLLDQAIAHGLADVTEDQVRDMLGLADRSQTFDLLEAVLKGDIAAALDLMDRQYRSGADPASLLEDMLDITHWLTRIKVAPSAADDVGVPEIERLRGKDMAARLPMAAIARAWQMMLKGLGEVRIAPSPIQAAEMVMVRLAYSAALPTPAEALKAMDQGTRSVATASTTAPTPAPARTSAIATGSTPSAEPALAQPRSALAVAVRETIPEPQLGKAKAAPEVADPTTFEQVAELAGQKRVGILRSNIINNLHLVHFEPGRIDVSLGDRAPRELPYELAKFLTDNTRRRWTVTVSNQPGQPTLQQQWDGASADEKSRVAKLPLVKAVLDAFPGATIGDVRHLNDSQ
ncbi:MAG TPA: DNA polymerase III subunit gamma/tau [Rhodospirillales bacterium]|nr:DNA polymerase III subunit gamma/tau [Rhodospirillales bacterium]